MTVEEAIETALFAHVLDLELEGAPPLAWPNVAFTPAAGPYIRVQHLRADNARLFVKGSAPHFRQGILQLTAVMPLGSGAAAATALASSIAEQCPADLDLFVDGVRVRFQRAPDVMTPFKTDVSWDVPVGVRYEAFA